jgi:hypothetical protein
MSYNRNKIQKDDTIQLELKERLNYPYIFQEGLLTINKAMNRPEMDIKRIQSLILNLYSKIPDTWIDDRFKRDIKACIKIINIDIRPDICGIPMGINECMKKGIDYYRQEEIIDYFALQTSIINLLDRRNMLVRRTKIEASTGVNLEYLDEKDVPNEDLEDLEDNENV